MVAGLLAIAPRHAGIPTAYAPGLALFRISIGDLEVPCSVFAVSASPCGTLHLRLTSGGMRARWWLLPALQFQRFMGIIHRI